MHWILNRETPPKLDSDQDPPKTPEDSCRGPSERKRGFIS